MHLQPPPEAEILSRPPPPPGRRVPYGPAPSQFAELRVPDHRTGPHPVVVLIHGGFWRARFSLEHLGHLCQAFVHDGLATWSIEYRRVGEPGGGWPGLFEDVGSACSKLAEIAPQHDLDATNVVAVGHSAGGHLALWLAATRKPFKGVVSLAGVADLRRAAELRLGNGAVQDLLGGEPADLPDRYAEASPIERLPTSIPSVLIHGTRDANVPIELSERYVDAARRAGDDARLERLADMGHFEPIDPESAAWPTVRASVHELLR